MELVRVKVKGIEDVVAILGKETDGDAVVYRGASDRVFAPDEVEEIGPYYERQPQPDDPLAQLPQEMVQMITDMVNGYIDRFDAMYWQRQRVEILKTIIQRQENNFTHVIGNTELADKYIQIRKNNE